MDYKLSHIYEYFDSKQKRYCNRLATACDFKSITKFKEYREECHKMVDWFGTKLQELNVEVTMRYVGTERLLTGEYIDIPRVIIGKLGSDLTKMTLLVYGHLDVDPADEKDGWANDPFDLTEIEGNLVGRGPSDDKGPCVSWLNVIEAFQFICLTDFSDNLRCFLSCSYGINMKLKIDFPMNLKFLFEAHQESGSEGFRSVLIDEKHKFLKNVDFIAISDNYWLGDTTPCITYGLRGICYYFIDIECASHDLHSGVYGGCIAEAMADMVYLMNALRDYNGRIQIPHFYDDVDRLLQAEIEYANVFSVIIVFKCKI